MVNEQTHPNVCTVDLQTYLHQLLLLLCQNADKIKYSAQQSPAVNVKHVIYIRGKVVKNGKIVIVMGGRCKSKKHSLDSRCYN